MKFNIYHAIVINQLIKNSDVTMFILASVAVFQVTIS